MTAVKTRIRRTTEKKAETIELYNAYQSAFNYFNAYLFEGKLPTVILNFSRKSKAMGFFAPERWSRIGSEPVNSDGIHEISINPEILKTVPVVQIVSTLVHEMCHLWEREFGKPTPGYHSKGWAAKMKSIGLQPSHNGQPGGREIGKKMSDYPIEGGRFLELFKKMPPETLLPFVCVSEPGKVSKPGKNKTKYVCLGCDTNVWGKDGLSIICGDCDDEFVIQK